MIKDAILRPLARRVFGSRLMRVVRDSQGDWRYLYLPASWWLARVLVPRRKVRVGEAAFTLSCDNPITHFRWFLFRDKEPEVRDYIDGFVKDGDIFFDIGTNIGVFSLYAGKTKQDIEIFCFEPEFSNLHYLKENVLKNGLGAKLNIYSLAVSDEDGMSQLHIQDVTPGAAVHTESREQIARTDEGFAVVWREGVATLTLDSICDKLGKVPDALKIDTDGNEPKILRGGKRTLANPALRSLILEMPPDQSAAADCADMLAKAGFELRMSGKATRNQVWARPDV